MANPEQILVVDDDVELGSALKKHLSGLGYGCDYVSNAADGAARARSGNYDLLILDVMLGDADGIALLQLLRSEGITTQILMLTSKRDELDVVSGLDAGADDYVGKPFKLSELEARIRALLRRIGSKTDGASGIAGSSDVLRFGDLVIDRLRRTVTRRGVEVELTSKEYDVLEILALSPSNALSRGEILEALGETPGGPYEYTINTTIWRLRKKIEDDVDKPRLIKSIRGYGYKLCPVSE